MASFSRVKHPLRNTLMSLLCFVGMLFVLYYLYLDWRYGQYVAEYDGTLPLLSRTGYLITHLPEMQIVAYSILIGATLMMLCVRIARKDTGTFYDQHINHMQRAVEGLEHHSSFQSQCLQRFKQIATGIHKAVARVEESYVLPSSEAKFLLNASTGLAEHLAMGICASAESVPIMMTDVLDQVMASFGAQLSEQNLHPRILCPSGTTFWGDPLFVKQILFNVIGAPLSCMPKSGKMVIQVSQDADFVHVELRDNRYVLSQKGAEQLRDSREVAFPFDVLVEERYLRHICHQNGVGYEASETPGGECVTRVSLPLDPAKCTQSRNKTNNVIAFPPKGFPTH